MVPIHQLECFLQQNVEVIGDVRIDPRQRTVWVRQTSIELTCTEFDILFFLCLHKGWVLTRQQIIDGVFGEEKDVSAHSVTAMIHKIRKKIRDSHTTTIKTIVGYGYKLQVK